MSQALYERRFRVLGSGGRDAAFPALASDGGASTGSEALFIAELALLLVVGRLTGEAVQRIGQPSVMGQLIGGVLLGPSFFGLLWPSAQHAIFPPDPAQKSMIDAVSELPECVGAFHFQATVLNLIRFAEARITRSKAAGNGVYSQPLHFKDDFARKTFCPPLAVHFTR